MYSERKAAFCHALAPCMFGSTSICARMVPFLANDLFPLKSLARMAWFLATIKADSCEMVLCQCLCSQRARGMASVQD